MKYLESVRRRFSAQPAFTVGDLCRFLKPRGITPGYLKQLVHNLLASGELRRITRGVYSFHEDTQIVGLAFQPYYYGLQDALSLHGFWEQETNPVVITPRKVRSGVRTFAGNNYLVRRISRKMFFGYRTMRYGDWFVNVSDPEKTLIDYAHFNAPLPAQALRELRKALREPVLEEYLRRCGPRTRKRVRRLLLATTR